MIDIEKSEYAKKAMANFKQGYNCSQAVLLAFADKIDVDEKMLLKMSSSFGGGMGRLREVCGGVTGMFMVAGFMYGYDDSEVFEEKSKHYERIQKLAGEFTNLNGSIICRDLLGLTTKSDSPVPEKRTEEYYKKRPCVEKVGMAAAIMEKYIEEYGQA